MADFSHDDDGVDRRDVGRDRQQRRHGGSPAPASSPSTSRIVRDAIKASGGVGEPWHVDGANAVRLGDLLLVIDADDLGWMATVYVIDGDEADPVAVRASETANPVRELAGWLQNAAGPMIWKRIKAGLYRSGEYLVGQLGTGEWFAEGPGVDRCFDHKNEAQTACATARLSPTAPPG
ncbi:hypothetical protein [Mycolicibacillus parakoreensis]|uniref:Uncharacterized protein n=1 Tax=Mycolicibacillus parakoreensis TaxID=1069221 RepID=A0ABY3U075_9MYCO|nr:hypothetical protein [Mycolicibacillus parakoreensis]ULN52877.1 hypothetical protein MIU77_00305 [Mycolicibacillus parakoreensis]